VVATGTVGCVGGAVCGGDVGWVGGAVGGGGLVGGATVVGAVLGTKIVVVGAGRVVLTLGTTISGGLS
jgi:hypothetical protein